MPVLHCIEHQHAFTLEHVHSGLYPLADSYLGTVQIGDAAHDAYAFFKVHQHHVVISTGFRLSADDAEGIDLATSGRLHPVSRLAPTMGAQDPGEKDMSTTFAATLDFEHALRQALEIARFGSACLDRVDSTFHCLFLPLFPLSLCREP